MIGRPSTLPHPNSDAEIPSVVAGVPECPSSLKGPARARWEHLAPLLAEAGVITKLDRDALQRYCVIYARLEKANGKLRRESEIKTGKRGGQPFMNPWLFVANKCIEQLDTLDKRLGLDRLARNRMGVSEAGAGRRIRARDRSKGKPPPVEDAG